MADYQTDYEKYRGKCKEMSEALIKENPDFKLIRGFYYCPLWNREEMHWWTVSPDGTIHDPTKKQFASNGTGVYREFDGYYECAECGKSVHEDKMVQQGNYPCCSDRCAMRLVGLI